MRSAINDLAQSIHEWARDKGWWAKYQQTRQQTPTGRNIQLDADQVASKLMLAVSELAEALEVVRDPSRGYTDVWMEGEKPEGLGIEIADCIIRLLDLSEALGIDIGGCISTKMGYNLTRPYKHGGKTI